MFPLNKKGGANFRQVIQFLHQVNLNKIEC